MSGVWALVRIDVRRRWGSLLVLALLVALSTGTVLAAATAAHRGATALGRLEAYSRPATVQVPNFDARVDVGVLATLPYVEAVARTSAGGIGLLDDGQQGSTEQNTPVDDVLFHGLERPVVVAGRLFDPAAPDEAVVTPAWARTMHRGVGDTAVVRLPTPREQATGKGNDVPQGPAVTVRIVGIVTTPAYLDWPGQPGWFIPSPGLAEHYRRNWDTSVTNPGCVCQWASVGAMVRLAHGADDIARLRTDLARLFPGHTFNVLNLDQQLQIHQHDVLVQSAGLLAFALAALVAAIVVLAQATGRHVSASRALLRTAAALGHTPR
ncbi:MAG TPA: hypothetical protein VN088_16360, partial [Nocardioides sp.]|nr:hypothetical protein [Nocardioides sp.]